MSLTPEQTERVLALARDFARQGATADLREFLEHGVPVDVVDADGNSLLMLAAYHGQTETVAMLLEAGADPNLRNGKDQTPIAGAMFKGEREIVQRLRDAGADLDVGTPTARQAAAVFGFEL